MTSEEVSLRNRIAMRWQLQNFAGERVLLWSTMRAIRFAQLFLAAALVSGCASFALAQAPAPSSRHRHQLLLQQQFPLLRPSIRSA